MRLGPLGDIRDLLFPELKSSSSDINVDSSILILLRWNIYLNWSSWFVQPVRLSSIKSYFQLVSQHDKPRYFWTAWSLKVELAGFSKASVTLCKFASHCIPKDLNSYLTVRTSSSGDFYTSVSIFCSRFCDKLGKNLLAEKTVLKDRELQALSNLADRWHRTCIWMLSRLILDRGTRYCE